MTVFPAHPFFSGIILTMLPCVCVACLPHMRSPIHYSFTLSRFHDVPCLHSWLTAPSIRSGTLAPSSALQPFVFLQLPWQLCRGGWHFCQAELFTLLSFHKGLECKLRIMSSFSDNLTRENWRRRSLWSLDKKACWKGIHVRTRRGNPSIPRWFSSCLHLPPFYPLRQPLPKSSSWFPHCPHMKSRFLSVAFTASQPVFSLPSYGLNVVTFYYIVHLPILLFISMELMHTFF